MMMTTHPTDTAYVGDDWVLPRTLGMPYTPLDGKTFQWVLADRGSLAQVIAPADATVIITDAVEGGLEIHVAAAITNQLASGRYNDALRIVNPDTTLNTVLTGQVHVLDPAFNATAPPTSP